MKPNWDWLMTILDSTEAQLRFGSALSSLTDSSGPGQPSTSGSLARSAASRGLERGYTGTSRAAAGSSDPSQNRKDFLTYALSLMRAHNGEHSDSLPVLDVSALKHIAYVFDALIYYMRSGTEEGGRRVEEGLPGHLYTPMDEDTEPEDIPLAAEAMAMETDSMDEDTNQSSGQAREGSSAGARGRKHPFFQRSDSTLCLGCPPPDPFSTSMAEALPLADQPQLLTPTARREDLFGIPRQQVDSGEGSASSPLNVLPTRLGLSTRAAPEKEQQLQLSGLGTGSAPYQSSATDQGFHSLVAGRAEPLSPAAATCGDADSVRSVDTTLTSVLSEGDGGSRRGPGEEDEPQDLSIRAEDLLAAGPSQEDTEDRGPTVSSFTSPKKMMLLREAAREREGLELGENRLATLAGVASELVAKASGSSSQDSAPEILVVPNTSDRTSSTQEVSANVTVETSRPRGAVTSLGSSVPHDILLGR